MADNITELIRKPQILRAAVKRIAQVGLNRTTVEDIGAEAGLSKGCIVHYYPTKEELMIEAFRGFFIWYDKHHQELIASQDNLLEKMLEFSFVNRFGSQEEFDSFRLIVDCMAMATEHETYRQLYRGYVNNRFELAKAALTQAIEEGKVSLLNVEKTARTIGAISQGIAIRTYLDPEDHSPAWARQAYRAAVTALLAAGGVE